MSYIKNQIGGLNTDPKSINSYKECLQDANKKFKKKKRKLCARGYCTAKFGYDVYPSAYANLYGVSVCKGTKPDLVGETYSNETYLSRLSKRKEKGLDKSDNSLKRWVNEKWVNVCEKNPNTETGYEPCGSGKGIHNIKEYPYCRPFYKLPGTTVKTVGELSKDILDDMCKEKRSLQQGIDGKPTRIFVKNKLNITGGSVNNLVNVPPGVLLMAKIGLKMKKKGYKGSTDAGIERGNQLLNNKSVLLSTVLHIASWMCRHGPDAINGGTSYPGYLQWLQDGSPIDGLKNLDKYRGAVSWLLWGGSPAYLWIKSKKINGLLKNEYSGKGGQMVENTSIRLSPIDMNYLQNVKNELPGINKK